MSRKSRKFGFLKPRERAQNACITRRQNKATQEPSPKLFSRKNVLYWNSYLNLKFKLINLDRDIIAHEVIGSMISGALFVSHWLPHLKRQTLIIFVCIQGGLQGHEF